MAIQIYKFEKQYYQYKKFFNDELSSMWQNHRNLIQNKGMTTTLTNLIEQRLNNITHRWREQFYFRFSYFLIHSYDDWDTMEENNEVRIKHIGFQPYIFIDTTKQHIFNDQQLKLLNRGPTYVPPQVNDSTLRIRVDPAGNGVCSR